MAKDSFPLVLVRWMDASFESHSVLLSELPQKIILDTVGWIVKEDDDYICVAGENYVEGGKGMLDGQARQVTCIPQAMVLEIHSLRKGRKREEQRGMETGE